LGTLVLENCGYCNGWLASIRPFDEVRTPLRPNRSIGAGRPIMPVTFPGAPEQHTPRRVFVYRQERGNEAVRLRSSPIVYPLYRPSTIRRGAGRLAFRCGSSAASRPALHTRLRPRVGSVWWGLSSKRSPLWVRRLWVNCARFTMSRTCPLILRLRLSRSIASS
jgi:hypothetical protein